MRADDGIRDSPSPIDVFYSGHRDVLLGPTLDVRAGETLDVRTGDATARALLYSAYFMVSARKIINYPRTDLVRFITPMERVILQTSEGTIQSLLVYLLNVLEVHIRNAGHV